MLSVTMLSVFPLLVAAKLRGMTNGQDDSAESTRIKNQYDEYIMAKVMLGFNKTYKIRHGTHDLGDNKNFHYKVVNLFRGDDVRILRFLKHGSSVVNFSEAWVRKEFDDKLSCVVFKIDVTNLGVTQGDRNYLRNTLVQDGVEKVFQYGWDWANNRIRNNYKSFTGTNLPTGAFPAVNKGSCSDCGRHLDTVEDHLAHKKDTKTNPDCGNSSWKDELPASNWEKTPAVTYVQGDFGNDYYGTIKKSFGPYNNRNAGLAGGKFLRFLFIAEGTRVRILGFEKNFHYHKYEFVWCYAYGIVFKMRTTDIELPSKQVYDHMLLNFADAKNTRAMGVNDEGGYGFRIAKPKPKAQST